MEKNYFDHEFPLLNDICDLINRYPFKYSVKDSWRWSSDSKGMFYTRLACKYISKSGQDLICPNLSCGFKCIWNRLAPRKFQLMLGESCGTVCLLKITLSGETYLTKMITRTLFFLSTGLNLSLIFSLSSQLLISCG